MDSGIKEIDFWDMTLAEIKRAIESNNRRIKTEAREKAAYDYILADLIGKSVARIYSSSARMPKIDKVYPSLFDSEEIKQQEQARKEKLFTERFKQFAAHHNKKLKEEVAKSE